MSFVEYFKNYILCALSALEGKEYNTQESCEYLVPILTRLVISTNDLETNKFVLISLLFRIWQHQQYPTDQLDYNVLKTNYELSTNLYLELIVTLNMENEFRKLLYSIPRLAVLNIIENIIYSNPSYGFRVVYDPALNVCNSLDDQYKSEFISCLLQMIVEHDKIIKSDDQLLVELFRSTAKHIENHINPSSSPDRKLGISQKLENIQSKVETNYFFSTLYYPDSSLQENSRQKRVYQTARSENITRIGNTSKSFEDSYADLKGASRDNKYLYQLLCLFDYLAFIGCKDERQTFKVSSLIKIIMHQVILRLKEADLINTLSSLNKIYSNKNETIDNLIKYINFEPQKKLSNLEFRSKGIARRLREDESEYRNAALNLKAFCHTNSKNDVPLNKHEEAFIIICRSLRQNLDYNTSFANRIENSDLTYKLSTLVEGLTKEDLSSHCHWVINSIRFQRLGFVSLLKLMLQYVDLFNNLNISEDIFSELIVEYGLQRELYQSIKRFIKNPGGTVHKIKEIKTGINLLLKALSLLSCRTRCLFRDFMLSDRPSDTNFETPTFNDWSIWPFEYNQRLTMLCNQIVFTEEISSQINDDYKSQLAIKNKEHVRSSNVDAFIELSMVTPYFMLDRLLWDCIHNKGEGMLILDILREIGSVCWFRQTSKSPTLMIKVIQYKLSSLDEGTLCFNLQEQKNLIDFLMLAMVGNTTKTPIELTLLDIGEWSNNKLLLDIREYINYCVIPYLDLDSPSLTGRKTTLSLSLDVLKALLSQPISTLPPTDVSWLMRSNPFILLKSMVRLINQRKAMSSLVINKIDGIYVVLKKLIKILAEYIPSFPDDQDSIHSLDINLAFKFYNESREYDWTTQLFLRSLFESCKDRLGLKMGKPIIPSMLFSFCDLSEEEFVIIEEDNENISEQATEIKQIMTFLEGCRVSDYWYKKFSSALNKSQTVTKPFLRNVFRTTAPFAFCYILANSAEEESSFLLDGLLKELFFYGCLSVVELLTIDDNDNELNELATADLVFDERISLCCLRFSFINILTSLRLLKEQQETSSNEQTNEQLSQNVINDFRIIQNIIKVTKESFITPNSTVNFLIVLFYTVAQALSLLSFSFKAEESLYIFLLFIVDQIDNARTLMIHEEKKPTTDSVDNEPSSSKNNRKKKKKLKRHQKGKQEELEQQIELTRDKTDTVDNRKSADKVSEANVKKNSEYFEWQEKLLIKGIDKVKNNNLGWRFTVADALGIRNEFISHSND